MKRREIELSNVETLLNWILAEAETARDAYQADKKNSFNQGIAQAYTEVMDYFGTWLEMNDIQSKRGDLRELAIKWFG